MLKTIMVANRKGGLGKTEITLLIAIYFSLVKRKKILIADFDPSNCSLSKQLLEMESDPTDLEGSIPPIHPDYDEDIEHNGWDGRCSTADIFSNISVITYQTKFKNLDILPAYSSKLKKIERTSQSLIKDVVYARMETWVNSKAIQDNYDLCIFDCQPTQSLTSNAIIKSASSLLIPTELEALSIEGVYAMLQAWGQENLCRTKHNEFKLLGILPNKFNKRLRIHNGYLDGLKNNAGTMKHILPFEIKSSKHFPEFDHMRIINKTGSVFDLPDSNDLKKNCISACQHIYKEVFSNDKHRRKKIKKGKAKA